MREHSHAEHTSHYADVSGDVIPTLGSASSTKPLKNTF